MKGKSKSEEICDTAEKCGLTLLRRRVKRLSLIVNPSSRTPPQVIAEEITLVLKAATLCYPKDMGEALIKGMRNSLCRESGFCIECGTLISDRKVGDVHCATCKERLDQIADLTLGE